jgi:hypothetical protein
LPIAALTSIKHYDSFWRKLIKKHAAQWRAAGIETKASQAKGDVFF